MPTPGFFSALQASPQGLFPFATNGRAFTNGQPYLGGNILILTSKAANTNLTIAHNLRGTPRQLHILYSTIFTPKWKAVQAWDMLNIYIQLDTAIAGSDFVTVLVA